MPLKETGLILFFRVEAVFYNRLRRLSVGWGIEEVSYYRFVFYGLDFTNLVASFSCEFVIVLVTGVQI